MCIYSRFHLTTFKITFSAIFLPPLTILKITIFCPPRPVRNRNPPVRKFHPVGGDAPLLHFIKNTPPIPIGVHFHFKTHPCTLIMRIPNIIPKYPLPPGHMYARKFFFKKEISFVREFSRFSDPAPHL